MSDTERAWARALGAQCDRCVLNGCRPVPSAVPTRTVPGRARLVVIGEAPGDSDDALGTPFAGASGRRLDTALAGGGLSRAEVYITHVVACRPPDNDLALAIKEINATRRNSSRAWDRYHADNLAYSVADIRFTTKLRAWEHRCAEIEAENAERATKGRKPRALPARPSLPKRLLAPRPAPPADDHPDELPMSPIAACLPRLRAELAAIPQKVILAFGKTAFTAVTGSADDYQSAFGLPYDTPDGVVYGLVPPAAITRGYNMPWPYWRALAIKAVKAARHGAPSPVQVDDMVVRGAAESAALDALLGRLDNGERVAVYVDVESTGLDFMRDRLRLVGLGWYDAAGACVIAQIRWYYRDRDEFWPDWDGARSRAVRVLGHTNTELVAHNGPFDYRFLCRHGIRLTPNLHCTQVLIAIYAGADGPKSLALWTALLSDGVWAWKGMGGADHGAGITDDAFEALAEYNAGDVYALAVVAERLFATVAAEAAGDPPNTAGAIYEQTRRPLRDTVQMSLDGLDRNPAQVAGLDAELRRHAAAALLDATEVLLRHFETVPETEVDPILRDLCVGLRPHAELRDALAAGVDLALIESMLPGLNLDRDADRRAVVKYTGLHDFLPFTPTGKLLDRRSVKKQVVAVALQDPRVPELASTFFGRPGGNDDLGSNWWGVVYARKMLSTFVHPRLGPDGRVYPEYNPARAPTGRWGAKYPNTMNLPGRMKAMYEAPDGWVFVGADFSAVELWVSACSAGADGLISALSSGDVHRANCEAIRGESFVDATSRLILRDLAHPGCTNTGPAESAVCVTDAAKFPVATYVGSCPVCREGFDAAAKHAVTTLSGWRTDAKRLVFAVAYQAGTQTVFNTLRIGNPNLTYAEVADARAAWEAAHPQLVTAVHARLREFHDRRKRYGIGWLDDKVEGSRRRRYYPNAEPPLTEAGNHAIQAGAHAIFMSAWNRASCEVDRINAAHGVHLTGVRHYGADDPRVVRMFLPVHDQIVLMVREHLADDAHEMLHREMPAPADGPYRIHAADGRVIEYTARIESGMGKTLKDC